MDSKIISKINKDVNKKFPDLADVKPTIRKQSSSGSKGNTEKGNDEENYLITYKFNASGPGGKKIPRWVRVVATSKGKIIKISTSK